MTCVSSLFCSSSSVPAGVKKMSIDSFFCDIIVKELKCVTELSEISAITWRSGSVMIYLFTDLSETH